jgi:hypothetical protein
MENFLVVDILQHFNIVSTIYNAANYIEYFVNDHYVMKQNLKEI